MLPDHDQCCIYFPTIVHGILGKGNSLNTEYTQCKAEGQALVTKTPSKVKTLLDDFDGEGKVDLILVTHAADDTKVGGGSWLYTPKHEAAAVAEKLVDDVGADSLKNANIWLWICQASVSGVGDAFRRTIPTGTVNTIYAPSQDIAGVTMFLRHNNVAGSDSFVRVR
jgi:hypothetical protein